MSGTNVWLKLKKSKKFEPFAFLLDRDNSVWQLPYTFCLNHTVEEIYENCLQAPRFVNKLEKFLLDIKKRLYFAPKNYDVNSNLPRRFSFEEFIKDSKKKNAFVFLALHGGDGKTEPFSKNWKNLISYITAPIAKPQSCAWINI